LLIFLLFSTQFIRIKKITSLLELPNCKKALGIVALQCGPWGRPAGAGGANSCEARRSLAGEGRGEGVLFGSSVGEERLPVGRAPAANGGGHGGFGSGEVRARSGLMEAGESSVGAHGHSGVLK
jgi:hypothetical protein